MTEQRRLKHGERHRWRVKAHYPFGLTAEAVDMPDIVGTIDLIYISSDKRVGEPKDFPPVGQIVDAKSWATCPTESAVHHAARGSGSVTRGRS